MVQSGVVVPLPSTVTVNVHDRGLQIAEHYGFSIYDAMIVATALLADCTILYSEDLQDGQVIDGQLMIRNPFISHSR